MPGFAVNGLGRGLPSTVKPYYKYTWDVQQFYGDNIGDNPGPQKLPLVYVREATLPSHSFEREEVQGASLVYKFAKSIKWDDVKFSWYDTVGLADIVRGWRTSVWTAASGLANPDDYKRTSVVRSLTFAWNKPIIWTMYNSWPSQVKSSDLTYTESDIKMIEVTLVYDWAEDSPPR